MRSPYGEYPAWYDNDPADDPANELHQRVAELEEDNHKLGAQNADLLGSLETLADTVEMLVERGSITDRGLEDMEPAALRARATIAKAEGKT